MRQALTRIWRWLVAHVRPLPLEKDPRTDSKDVTIGFRFWF